MGIYACVCLRRDWVVLAQVPEQDKFDWARQWYPVAFVDDLEPTKPHSIELLGKRLVLWRDAEKRWRTFEDKCPHRLAPLSGDLRQI